MDAYAVAAGKGCIHFRGFMSRNRNCLEADFWSFAQPVATVLTIRNIKAAVTRITAVLA